MTTYRITNSTSGADLGTYEGATPLDEIPGYENKNLVHAEQSTLRVTEESTDWGLMRYGHLGHEFATDGKKRYVQGSEVELEPIPYIWDGKGGRKAAKYDIEGATYALDVVKTRTTNGSVDSWVATVVVWPGADPTTVARAIARAEGGR